jgi:cation diffusion facilitator CzcD-associated flavoprotein CzcO
VLDNHRSTPDLPTECDILIIGGGYAGIGAAYHLLGGEDAIAGKSIVLLEARQACSGATGRNGLSDSSSSHQIINTSPRWPCPSFGVSAPSVLH